MEPGDTKDYATHLIMWTSNFSKIPHYTPEDIRNKIQLPKMLPESIPVLSPSWSIDPEKDIYYFEHFEYHELAYEWHEVLCLRLRHPLFY